MPYPPLVAHTAEADYRAHFERVYCQGPIATFDGYAVRFRKRDFDHCFFESARRDGRKDTFSTARAERIDWIKATLEDPASELYQGWDKRKKCYDRGRRVAVVMGNYVVIIAITGPQKADFVTAYVANTPATVGRPVTTIDQIRRSPRWQ